MTSAKQITKTSPAQSGPRPPSPGEGFEYCERHKHWWQAYNEDGHWIGRKCDRCVADSRLHRSGIPPRFRGRTLANFKATTKKQSEAFDRIKTYAEKFPEMLRDGTGLIFVGPPGVGKTHLGCALVGHVIYRHGLKAGYTSAVDLMRRLKNTYRKNAEVTYEDVLAKFTTAPLLVIDEIGINSGTEHDHQLLYEVLNGRYERGLPSVLISNQGPEELNKALGDRLADRMREGQGSIIPFAWESYRGRAHETHDSPAHITYPPAFGPDERYQAGNAYGGDAI